jgi:hypothetical protein
MFLVSSTTPPFDALYELPLRKPSMPSTLAMLTMLPLPCASITGSTCFETS